MKWEPNIVGNPISVGDPASVWQKQSVARPTEGLPVGHANSVTPHPKIVDLSDNVMLAHYQRDRR